MDSEYFSKINLALEVAAKAHLKQKRKGTDIPYIIHPAGVALILSQEGYSEDLIIAGILHDVVEDTEIKLDFIRMNFGDKIAAIVEGCTEPDKFWSWKKRKCHTIELLKTASMDIKLVSCADKLHNIRTMITDYKKFGEKVWKRFKAGREEYEWYFNSVLDSLYIGVDEKDTKLFNKFKSEVESFFGKKEN
jgi:(p)ppGpp synthase/HD superfamily hydrolase